MHVLLLHVSALTRDKRYRFPVCQSNWVMQRRTVEISSRSYVQTDGADPRKFILN